VPAIIAPRAALPRSYPATPLVAPPDGSRLSTTAREAIGQSPRQPASASASAHIEPTRREPVSESIRSTTPDAETFLTQDLAQSAGSDEPARSLHRRANAAYVRMRDSHIQLLPGRGRIDITV
jgi:hypothetical protein